MAGQQRDLRARGRVWQVRAVPVVGHASSAPALGRTAHRRAQAEGDQLVAKADADHLLALRQQLRHARAQLHHPGFAGEGIGPAAGQQHGVEGVKGSRVLAQLGAENLRLPVRTDALKQPDEEFTKAGVALGQMAFEDVVVQNAQFHCYNKSSTKRLFHEAYKPI